MTLFVFIAKNHLAVATFGIFTGLWTFDRILDSLYFLVEKPAVSYRLTPNYSAQPKLSAESGGGPK